jgi:exodeoxyribonuclease VII large subunit
MAVPVRSEIIIAVKDTQRRMNLLITRFIEFYFERISSFKKAFPDFKNIVNNKIQRVDDIAIRLIHSKSIFFERKTYRLNQLYSKLKNPRDLVVNKFSTLQIVSNKMINLLTKFTDQKEYKLNISSSMLKTLSYHNTLERGFAIIRDGTKIISSKNEMQNKEMIIEFKDGNVKFKPL